jgi:stage II sporulation SpoE-like protein/TIR domain-containing protein/NACHT domain-containing protein
MASVRCPQCRQAVTQVGKFWVCPEHGPVEPEAGPAPGDAPGRQVFISYGRADAREFVTRLAADLERGGGYRVWVDTEDIEKGGSWEVRIEQGIRASSVVAAVMTPHSVREESVCRDEVAFALYEGKPVVPLRADPKVRPTLLLARRNWVDFTTDYEAGVKALLRFLAGEDAALNPPPLATVAGTLPLDFGPEIARYSAGFSGRGWLLEEIDAWLGSGRRSRVLVLVGEPGMGKSALAARLCLARAEQVVGVHFCTHRNSRTLDPHEFVASLVAQLHSRLPGFAEAVEARRPELRRPTAADALRELVVEPARTLAFPAPLLVVVDSLDEAAGRAGETIVDLLAEGTDDLPDWLRIVTTTRPEAPVLERIRSLNIRALEPDQPENREDVRRYLRTRLARLAAGADTRSLEARLDELAAGNFLYAAMALDALEEGAISAADLDALSPGLESFYAGAFRRRFSDREEYRSAYAPLLRALAAARTPVPVPVLGRACGADAETTHGRLRDLRVYLRPSGEEGATSWALFHRSLREWLTDPDAAGDYWCDVKKGHAQLAQALAEPISGEEEYRWRSLAHHLFKAGDRDRLRERITPPFLSGKVQRCGYAVLEDLELLSRAMLEAGDPLLVERCVALLDGLREVVGGDLIEDTRRAVHSFRPVPAPFRSRVVAPPLPSVPGFDLYAGMLPRIEVGADFFEIIPAHGKLFLAVGDVPGAGLRSAFVARFIGTLVRRLVEQPVRPDPGEILAEVDRIVSTHDYFQAVSLQCIEIDPGEGILTLANAGHPSPVLFSARRNRCARFRVPSPLLHSVSSGGGEDSPPRAAPRHAEIEAGDVLVLVSDGLLEGNRAGGDRYDYRFTRLVEELAGSTAKPIGEAILEDWRAHPREGDYGDDVTLLVVKNSPQRV